MKSFSKNLALAAGCFISSVSFSQAEDTSTAAKTDQPVVVQTMMPVFHPPDVTGGVMPVRVGGGSRGGASDGVTLNVLVPDAVALTAQAQPTLYWYQSKPSQAHCIFTLTEPKKAKPLLVMKSSAPAVAGIHTLRLSDHKVKLTPKVVYKWSVALVVDPANRSQDIIANGVVEYVEPSPDLAAKLQTANDANRTSIYAQAGIWYDALDSISTQIQKEPQDQALRN